MRSALECEELDSSEALHAKTGAMALREILSPAEGKEAI
jgi:hypothetical protein